MIDNGQLLRDQYILFFAIPENTESFQEVRQMSEESKGSVKVHAIGRLKISVIQASIAEDYNSIDARIRWGR